MSFYDIVPFVVDDVSTLVPMSNSSFMDVSLAIDVVEASALILSLSIVVVLTILMSINGRFGEPQV